MFKAKTASNNPAIMITYRLNQLKRMKKEHKGQRTDNSLAASRQHLSLKYFHRETITHYRIQPYYSWAYQIIFERAQGKLR